MRAAHDHDVLHEDRHRRRSSAASCATTTSCSSAVRRSTRSSAWPWAPTRTAGTRRRGRDRADARRRAPCPRRDADRAPRRASSSSAAARWPASSLPLTRRRARTSTLACLPTPAPQASRRASAEAAARCQAPPRTAYDRLFVGVRRLRDRPAYSTRVDRGGRRAPAPGAHCYEFYAGVRPFAALQDEEARHVLPDRLPRPPLRLRSCAPALGLDAHPELRGTYFGNYRRARATSPRPTIPR